METKFAYWDIHGLGQNIRNLLNYVRENYEEKTYKMGAAIDFDRTEWLKEKFTLGLKFPNIPYYIRGDVKITQSLAIVRYLARKYNLTAKNESEQQQVDMLEQQLLDYKQSIYTSLVHPNHAEKLKEYKKNLPQSFKLFSDLFQGKQWLMGDRITYLDFMAYDVLVFNLTVDKGCIDLFPNLKNFMARFEALPTIKEYFGSDEYRSLCINTELWCDSVKKS